MYTLTDRLRRMREDQVHTKSMTKKICAQHAFWSRWGLYELAASGLAPSNSLAVGASVASVIDNHRTLIGPDDVIVGYNFGDGAYFGLTGDRARDEDILRENGFSDGQIAWYFDPDVPLYKGPWLDPPSDDDFTPQELTLQRELAAINSAGRFCMTGNHSVIGYHYVLELGFEGLYEKVDRWAKANGDSDFYEAMRMVCRAGMRMGERWADEAERIGRADIARVCRRVPRKGARTFREAVQSLWFAHIVNTWEDDINANSLGRLDQVLYPWYKRDIDAGVLTRQGAFELVCDLWLKLYRDYDVQQSCVGGASMGGASQVNDLSWMMLEATEQLDFVRCLSVRFGRGTNPRFVEKAPHVVGRVQKGVPFFFNDDVMVPALIEGGVAEEDAWDYTQIGCVETVIPGKSNPYAVNSRANVLKALEYALNGGRSGLTGEAAGPDTGDPLTFDTFEKLEDAVKAQLDHLIRATVDGAVKGMAATAADFKKPVKSLLTDGCLEKGRDFNDGGPVYNYYQLMLVGVPNLADSLAAVKTLVYEKKRYTLRELIFQLKNDWPSEAARLDFVNKAPKYGNDIDEVDEIAANIINYACDRIKIESDRVGHIFHAQPFSFLWMIDHGRMCAASPDGRRKGEILAYSLSPMQGRDREGLSALLNSIAKLPQKRTPATTSAIVEVDPRLFTDENLPMLCQLLMGAAEQGLGNVQFNTVSVETLLDAQAHPENHKNLAVRVSGFSQKFNLLSRELQDHIIARTKHAAI